jgi:putative ABC transport system permease protein
MEQVSENRYDGLDKKPIDEIRIKSYVIDEDFIKVFKIPLLAGSNFSNIRNANRNKIIINQSAMQLLNIKYANDAINRTLSRNKTSFTIIGVYSDFHQESLHSAIKPIVFTFGHPRNFGNYSIRINSNNKSKTIEQIKSEWSQIYLNDPFNYSFEDNFIDQLYKQETGFGKLFIIFTIMSIFIACLGLLGLIVIILSKSKKAIGVRKVNGAKVWEIIAGIQRDFVIGVGIALLIAFPIAYLIMKRWLQDFAYRTELSWWIFALSGLMVLTITILTVSWQSWRAATGNPVESLRSE